NQGQQMDTPSYKVKISDPCSFGKSVLEDTLYVLKENNAPETTIIELAFKNGGMPKPITHNHSEGFDYYWVKCTDEEADNIAGYLFDAEAAAVPASGEITPEASKYAKLVDIWTNFRDWLERGGSVEPHWEDY
ncbi:hypothetical protein, partial [Desulfocicer niacini]